MDADPIIEEVRRIRREYAERFGYDLRAVAADLRKREQQHPGRLVSFPPKPARKPAPVQLPKQGMQSAEMPEPS